MVLCMHFQFKKNQIVVIFIASINLYGTDDVSVCTCMWCGYGDEYKNRVVFLICDRYYYHAGYKTDHRAVLAFTDQCTSISVHPP